MSRGSSRQNTPVRKLNEDTLIEYGITYNEMVYQCPVLDADSDIASDTHSEAQSDQDLNQSANEDSDELSELGSETGSRRKSISDQERDESSDEDSDEESEVECETESTGEIDDNPGVDLETEVLPDHIEELRLQLLDFEGIVPKRPSVSGSKSQGK